MNVLETGPVAISVSFHEQRLREDVPDAACTAATAGSLHRGKGERCGMPHDGDDRGIEAPGDPAGGQNRHWILPEAPAAVPSILQSATPLAEFASEPMDIMQQTGPANLRTKRADATKGAEVLALVGPGDERELCSEAEAVPMQRRIDVERLVKVGEPPDPRQRLSEPRGTAVGRAGDHNGSGACDPVARRRGR